MNIIVNIQVNTTSEVTPKKHKSWEPFKSFPVFCESFSINTRCLQELKSGGGEDVVILSLGEVRRQVTDEEGDAGAVGILG